MTTTTEPATKCPAWCEQHPLDDEGCEWGEWTVHQRRVTVGDASVVIEETTGAPEGHPTPSGPTVTEVDFLWINEEAIRNYAAALNQAADILGIAEVTA